VTRFKCAIMYFAMDLGFILFLFFTFFCRPCTVRGDRGRIPCWHIIYMCHTVCGPHSRNFVYAAVIIASRSVSKSPNDPKPDAASHLCNVASTGSPHFARSTTTPYQHTHSPHACHVSRCSRATQQSATVVACSFGLDCCKGAATQRNVLTPNDNVIKCSRCLRVDFVPAHSTCESHHGRTYGQLDGNTERTGED